MIQRRELITLLGGAAVCPIAARGQQRGRMRRIGVLMTIATGDSESLARLAALLHRLEELGWVDGRNMRMEYRWAPGGDEDRRKVASELLMLAPDVILANGSGGTESLLQTTRTLPIVFVLVPDPVAAGYVESLARPGGNVTGFTNNDYGMGGKWLELLKQIAPRVTRVGVLRDISQVTAVGQFSAIQSVAPSLNIDATPLNARDTNGIENAISGFVRSPSDGLIVVGSGLAVVNRNLIITLAARHQLPAIYWDRLFVSSGGLISYGGDSREQYRQAASYIDRILKGEKPADLPVQNPTKVETAINLKTAKALGLDVPAQLLVRADEVIE
jgi:putative tryptophan/tyrosine transport system substrate-binding protein